MKIYLEKGKWAFGYQNQKYYIPSALYPLTHNPQDKNIYVITDKDLSEIRDEKILSLLNSTHLSIGRCYDNSQKIYQTLKNEGYKVGYFSGWLFIGGSLPIHHAWVVLEHENSLHIIDSAYHKISEIILGEMEGQSLDSLDKARQYYLDASKRLMKQRPQNTDRITAGKPPGGYVYIGTDNSYKESIKTYTSLAKMKNHPSYSGGMNINGDSIMQEMIKQSEL